MDEDIEDEGGSNCPCVVETNDQIVETNTVSNCNDEATAQEKEVDLSELGASGVSPLIEDRLYVNQACLNSSPHKSCTTDRLRRAQGWSWLHAEVHSVQRDPPSVWAQLSWSVEAPSQQDWIGLYFLRKFD